MQAWLADSRPIIACATGNQGNTALAVIRLSGFKNLADLQCFFSIELNQISPRYTYLTKVIASGKTIDQVILTFFKAPYSYTGENVIELSVHGNKKNISNIISLFIDHANFRHAVAGEFSYRALRNRKMTVSQLEGLDLLLNAHNQATLEYGQKLLHGELNDKYNNLRQSFLKLRSSVELAIDFSDDVGDDNVEKNFKNTLMEFESILNELYHRISFNDNLLLHPKIVIVGSPNAGKSSFFNNILRFDRALVSQTPGTTRDYLTETITIDGNDYILTDTAGIRDIDDSVESQGIKLALKLCEHAFFKVLIVNPFDLDINYLQYLQDYHFDIVIFSHSDLKNFNKKLESFKLTAKFDNVHKLNLLIKNDYSFLLEAINKKYSAALQRQGNFIYIPRHRESIVSIFNHFQNLQENLKYENDWAIVANELFLIGNEIDELVGIISNEEVYSFIFENFCIGK
ncbi:MAG: tRNA uridine-5-carboxymethylaminomethyl(34) synthesis GTPase MnmE [bacterium]